jgi:hypothetical protein
MIGGSLLRGGSYRGEKRCLIDDFAIFLQQPLTQPPRDSNRSEVPEAAIEVENPLSNFLERANPPVAAAATRARTRRVVTLRSGAGGCSSRRSDYRGSRAHDGHRGTGF